MVGPGSYEKPRNTMISAEDTCDSVLFIDFR